MSREEFDFRKKRRDPFLGGILSGSRVMIIGDEEAGELLKNIPYRDSVFNENGWAFLGDVGNLVLKKQPNFDPRNYGFLKLTPLIKSLPQFEIDKRETDKAGIKLVFIRNKE